MKHVLTRPVISEKSLTLAARGWYTFRTQTSASKKEIAAEIAKHYKVDVISVRTITMHGKVRRTGRRMTMVQKSDWKKAIVQLKAGQKIDAFEITAPEGEKA